MGSLCCCCDCCGKKDENNNKNGKEQKDIESQTKSPERTKSSIQESDTKIIIKSSLKSNKSKTGSDYGEEGIVSNNKNSLYKYNDIDEEQTEEKNLFEEEKLKEELNKHAVKGNESAYAKVIRSHPNLREKSLSNSQYNESGFVDKKSKEFLLVYTFMKTRGYDVSESIGSGNYAEVYKAFNVNKKKNVAIKVIDLKKANNNYRVNFLPREIAIVRQLKHKNIIKIYEVSQTGNKIYMVMEWAANGTIADWTADKGSFPEHTAWVMFREILEGLHYMHSMRIAHRDLKLENILLTAKCNPKLSDFSYAVVMQDKNKKSQTFCGSLPYFAPEILQTKPYNPFVSDVWSLGVCLFIMLNDGLPFPLGDHRIMVKKQLSSDWHFKNKVKNQLSEGLKSMVKKMLEPDVHIRATTNILMAHNWILNQPEPGSKY